MPPKPPKTPKAPKKPRTPNHDRDFNNAVKELKKVKDPNDVDQKAITTVIRAIFRIDPCEGTGLRWNSTTQQCE